MIKEKIYRRVDAAYYDKIYHQKNYKKEAEFIHKAIKKYSKVRGRKLLDIPIGTGKHSVLLRKFGYKVVGADISTDMLKIAKTKLKGIRLVKANMKDFNLEEKFDALICMFSSINYNRNYKNLKSTLKNFHNHLQKGGILIFDVGFYPFKSKLSPLIETYLSKDLQIARFAESTKRGNKVIIKFVMVIKKGDKIKILRDEHKLGYLNPRSIKKIMESAGFKTFVFNGFTFKSYRYNKKSDRPVFVGIKPVD